MTPPPKLQVADVPIIGRRINEQAVKLAEELLAKLREGEAVNVAFVSERATGEMMIASAIGGGDPMKILGSTVILTRQVQDAMIALRKEAKG